MGTALFLLSPLFKLYCISLDILDLFILEGLWLMRPVRTDSSPANSPVASRPTWLFYHTPKDTRVHIFCYIGCRYLNHIEKPRGLVNLYLADLCVAGDVWHVILIPFIAD